MCSIRHARIHKLRWSGPILYIPSYAVDQTTAKKQIIVAHLEGGMSNFKKAADKILYKREQNKGKKFKDISDRAYLQ